MQSSVSLCCAGSIHNSEVSASHLDRAFWDPVSGRIMDSQQCMSAYLGFPGVSLLTPISRKPVKPCTNSRYLAKIQ